MTDAFIHISTPCLHVHINPRNARIDRGSFYLKNDCVGHADSWVSFCEELKRGLKTQFEKV